MKFFNPYYSEEILTFINSLELIQVCTGTPRGVSLNQANTPEINPFYTGSKCHQVSYVYPWQCHRQIVRKNGKKQQYNMQQSQKVPPRGGALKEKRHYMTRYGNKGWHNLIIGLFILADVQCPRTKLLTNHKFYSCSGKDGMLIRLPRGNNSHRKKTRLAECGDLGR